MEIISVQLVHITNKISHVQVTSANKGMLRYITQPWYRLILTKATPMCIYFGYAERLPGKPAWKLSEYIWSMHIWNSL